MKESQQTSLPGTSALTNLALLTEIPQY